MEVGLPKTINNYKKNFIDNSEITHTNFKKF